MTAKQQLRELVDDLSEEQASEALALWDMRADPMIVAFRDAPLDDEPITPEEKTAIAEAEADIAAGRTVSLEEAMREFE